MRRCTVIEAPAGNGLAWLCRAAPPHTLEFAFSIWDINECFELDPEDYPS